MKELIRAILPRRLWAALRSMRIQHSIKSFKARDVTHNYGGTSYRIHLADPMAQGWYDQDAPELPEITLLRRGGLKPGARVFDLGAHQCVVALQLAHIVGPAGTVVAVEGGRHNVDVAMKNRELNSAAQLQVLHAAVAERSGRVSFTVSLNGRIDDRSGGWETDQVDAVTIDDLSDRYGFPDVLFIDIEGFELAALRGATRTMQHRPDCFVEVHTGVGLEKAGGSVDQVLAFFPRRDYESFIASEDRRNFVPLAERTELTKSRFFFVALAR